jgi:L-threonylcarbamoyladenylate synthase
LQTRVITVNPIDPEVRMIEEGAHVVEDGGVIGYPTETVYGLGADAYNAEALERVFKIKGRETGKPISVLVASMEMLEEITTRIPPVAMGLIRDHWPGPLTIIFEASQTISASLVGESGKIGVRISPHRVPQRLLEILKRPITSTSANLSGMPSLSDPEELFRVFRGKIDLVLDGGKTKGGGVSTVVDVTVSPPRMVREGVLKIKAELGGKVVRG